MKWLKKIKIGTKIIITFLLVAAIFGVVGCIGIINIQAIENDATLLYEKNTMGIAHTGNASIYYQRIRFNALKMTVFEDVTEQQTYIKKINSHTQEADDYLKQYEQTCVDEESRGQYAELNTTWEQYKACVSDAIQYVQSGNLQKASNIILGEAADIGANLQKQFEDLFK